MAKEKVSISWSGGKDASFAFYKIFKDGNYDVVSLHTTLDAVTKKVGLHGVHEKLIDQQALELNIPLDKIYLNKPGAPATYEDQMIAYYTNLKRYGVEKIISGDIFLEDLRKYKEAIAEKAGLKIEFPLWGIPTSEIVEGFIKAGFKSMICAADAKHFTINDLGKTINKSFIRNLPNEVDACGENGEFHSYTYYSPLYKHPIAFVERGRYAENYDFKTDNGNRIHSRFFYLELSLNEPGY